MEEIIKKINDMIDNNISEIRYVFIGLFTGVSLEYCISGGIGSFVLSTIFLINLNSFITYIYLNLNK